MREAKEGQFAIEFEPSGQGKARCAPNPNYPKGIDIDFAGQAPGCKVALPYPASECGYWRGVCKTCGMSFAITAAGRADDPKSVTVPCKEPVYGARN